MSRSQRASKREFSFRKAQNAIPDSYDSAEDKLFDIFNNARISNKMKRRIAEASHSSTQAYLWMIETLEESELPEYFSRKGIPGQEFELEAYLYNPNIKFTPYEGSSLKEILLSNRYRNYFDPLRIVATEETNRNEVYAYVITHLLEHQMMTLELAGELISDLAEDRNKTSSLFGIASMGKDEVWPVKPLLEWVRTKYSLEDFPDSFVIEFTQPPKGETE